MSGQPYGGYFGLSDMWSGKPNAVKPQSGFWNKIDAIGVFFIRFSVIFWIISLIISILSWLMIKDVSSKIANHGIQIKMGERPN